MYKSIFHSKKYDSFVKLLESQKCILIALIILVLTGSFLRIYGVSHVYTEYDDIGVVSIHKAHVGSKEINLIEGLIDYPIKVDMESAHSIENNLFLPFYIAYTWTYAPGQYVFLPLLINEDNNYEEVLVKGRLLSALFSIVGICILAYLMYMYSGYHLNWSIPIVLTIPIFSSNSILYAHHMSPYSAYFLSSALALLLIYQYALSKISFRRIIFYLSILIYLSYLTVLFALPVFLIYFFKLLSKKDLHFSRNYFRDLTTILIGFIISLPALLFIKSSSGGKGLMPPEYSGLESLQDFFLHLTNQFFISIQSIIYGFIRHDYLFLLLALLISYALIKKIFLKVKKINTAFIFIASTFVILLQWVILHLFAVLPLDETRHMLILLPIIVILIFYLLKDNFILNNCLIAIPAIILLAFSASAYTLSLIESKYSNFKYSILDERDEKVILLYRSTLGPLKYYDEDHKKVYFIDMNSFQDNYLEMQFPNEILLVSQQTEIYNEGLLEKYKDLLPKLFCNYEINSLYKKDSEIYFTYNNYSANSNKNGMFVYQMQKTKKNKC